MNSLWLWLTLAAAVAAGWYLGRAGRPRLLREEQERESLALRQKLDLLLKTYSDEAIEAFVRSLAVSPQTVGLHLSIGTHFREKGEVDRAIVVHQNLLAQPELPARYSPEVTFALAQDYHKAGLLDRAESLLTELMGFSEQGPRAARELVRIYAKEKEWEKARKVCEALVSGQKSPELRKELAYIHCELASCALSSGQPGEAEDHVREALRQDRNCVRASFLLARLKRSQGQYRKAEACLFRVFDQNPAFGPEAAGRLLDHARQDERELALLHRLERRYLERPDARLLLALASCEQTARGAESAARLLRRELQSRPNLPGLLALIELNEQLRPDNDPDFHLVQRVGKILLGQLPGYRCVRCGFGGEELHWQCPRCQRWETVQPLS